MVREMIKNGGLVYCATLLATTMVLAQESTLATPNTGNVGEHSIEIKRSREKIEADHEGISRVMRYDVWSADIDAEFEGYRIAFVTDIHYPSRFDTEHLLSLANVLVELKPNALLLGGDYQEGCEYVDAVLQVLEVSTPNIERLAVLGNNDIERCTDEIKSLMKAHNIRLLEDETVRLSSCKGNAHIQITGVTNKFNDGVLSIDSTVSCPTTKLDANDFIILLTHTPDYAEQYDVTNADLTLAGHTHGGQVTLLGTVAPITASLYGQRFVKGLNYNTKGQTIITSNGIGTSRKKIRFCAPSEVVVIVLHTKED